MSIVLDTNAVLYFLAGRLAEPLPQANFFCVSDYRNRIIVLSITQDGG